MGEFFSTDYNGSPFVLFGAAHWTALGVILLINLSLFWVRKSQNRRLRDIVRYTLAGSMAVSRLLLYLWIISTGQWNIQWYLPLHLCSVSLWLSVYMLLTKNYRAFEYTYFLGIGGAIWPLLTPDAGRYGFPHFYPIQFFLSHAGIITASVYMVVVEGYRPYWSSLKRAFIGGNLYLLFVTGVNLLIGSNYMYTLRKPPVATPLDYFGPWPWYLVIAEAIALLLFVLLYAPFYWLDRRARE
jgi:hypothetical integral membrane protein (TIGR02206 family)